jgi:DNA-binding IclR family transcriptional regulator
MRNDLSLRKRPTPGRPSGKLGTLLDAIAAPTGATLDELSTASGWLPHTTRAALTRLRQRGFDVCLATTDGRKAYQPVPA